MIRWKNVLLTMLSFQLSRRRPKLMKALLRKGVERQLPPGYDIDTHFKPRYNPWDQRLCLVPDADLFEAIGERAGVGRHRHDRDVHRDGACSSGSGGELEADLIVTATGLNMLLLGGDRVAVDGEAVDFPRR